MSLAEWLLAHEPVLRLGCFLLVFTLMASWEWWLPCRTRRYSRTLRWSNNLGLVAINTILLRWLFPVAAIGLAQLMSERGQGLFNQLAWPLWLEVLLAVMIFDLLIYLQHVVFHKVPVLWRLHQVHHADPDYDVTTGARFHPLEILLSMLLKMLAVWLLGPAAVAVFLFELLLNASAMFNSLPLSPSQHTTPRRRKCMKSRFHKPNRLHLVTGKLENRSINLNYVAQQLRGGYNDCLCMDSTVVWMCCY